MVRNSAAEKVRFAVDAKRGRRRASWVGEEGWEVRIWIGWVREERREVREEEMSWSRKECWIVGCGMRREKGRR